MPLLYRILWSLAIIFAVIATVVFSIWIVIIGAVLYALYRIYLYFVLKKGFGKGKTGQRGPIHFKVYSNYTGPNQSGRPNSPRGFANGEVIDMPAEEVTDPRNSFPRE